MQCRLHRLPSLLQTDSNGATVTVLSKETPRKPQCLPSALQPPTSPNVFLQKLYSQRQHIRPGWHQQFPPEGLEKIKGAPAMYICTNYRPVLGTESNYFTRLSSSWLSVRFYPALYMFPSLFSCFHSLRGALILYASCVCPKEVKVTFDPRSLGKAATQLTWNLGFLNPKFKEMFSCMGKHKTPTRV